MQDTTYDGSAVVRPPRAGTRRRATTMPHLPKRALWGIVGGLALLAAGSRPAGAEFRVQVTVDCEDAGLKNRITSFLSRELRDLGDVVMTESDPHYRISVGAIAAALEGGHEAGYALSVLITEPPGDFSRTILFGLADPVRNLASRRLMELDLLTFNRVSRMLKEREALLSYGLFLGPEDALRLTLEERVAEFDVEVLEPRRQWERGQQKAREALQEIELIEGGEPP